MTSRIALKAVNITIINHISHPVGGGGGTSILKVTGRGRAAGQGMILRSSILAQGILWPSCGHQY